MVDGVGSQESYRDIGFRLPEHMISMTPEKESLIHKWLSRSTAEEYYDTVSVMPDTKRHGVEILQAWALNDMLDLGFGSNAQKRPATSLSHMGCSFESTFLESDLTISDLGIRDGLFESKEEATTCMAVGADTDSARQQLCIEDMKAAFLQNFVG